MAHAEHFDAVVVGSGFGGAVMACRLSEGGKKVCVLERGKKYGPGDFPRSPYDMSKNFWDPSKRLYGLFNVWSFTGIEGIVSSGLGGGSLVYANVLLRKSEETFVHDLAEGGYESWCVTRRELDPYYDKAERALNAQAFPIQHAPYDQVPKAIAMKAAYDGLKTTMGDNVELVNPLLGITFWNDPNRPVQAEPIHDGHLNVHRRGRLTCRMCGECDLGCNYGAKNSVDFNYLSVAERHGADLRVGHEVRSFSRRNGKWEVLYVDHGSGMRGEQDAPTSKELPELQMTCDKLIIAAGTFGTTYLMMKNLQAIDARPREALGHRFCGNGDVLTFLRNACLPGNEKAPRPLDGGKGPVITSALKFRDERAGGPAGRREFWVQDAGYPEFVNWLAETSDLPAVLKRSAMFLWHYLRLRLGLSKDTDIGAELASILGNCRATHTSMPLLSMGRDVPDGKFCVDKEGYLDVNWNASHKSNPYISDVTQNAHKIADALYSSLDESPLAKLSRVITVHPLGGCPMGRDEHEGVVDSYGKVFNTEGLYVADGAMLPGPTGPNPSLTIAALAERGAERMLNAW